MILGFVYEMDTVLFMYAVIGSLEIECGASIIPVA